MGAGDLGGNSQAINGQAINLGLSMLLIPISTDP